MLDRFLFFDLPLGEFCSFDSLTGIRVCDALCMEGGYRLLSGECNMQLIGRTTQIITVDILYGLPIYPAVLFWG